MRTFSSPWLAGGLLSLVAACGWGCGEAPPSDEGVGSSQGALTNDHPISLSPLWGASAIYHSLPYEGARPTRVRFVQTSEPKQFVSLHVGVEFKLGLHAPTDDYVEYKTEPAVELRYYEQPKEFTIRVVNYSDQPVTGFVHMELIEDDPPAPAAAAPDAPPAPADPAPADPAPAVP